MWQRPPWLCAHVADRRSQHVRPEVQPALLPPLHQARASWTHGGAALRSGAQPTPGPAPGAATSPADGPQVHPLPPPRPQWLPSFRGFCKDILARPHVHSLPPALRPRRPLVTPTCLRHTGPAACPSPRTANSLLPGHTGPTRAGHLLRPLLAAQPPPHHVGEPPLAQLSPTTPTCLGPPLTEPSVAQPPAAARTQAELAEPPPACTPALGPRAHPGPQVVRADRPMGCPPPLAALTADCRAGDGCDRGTPPLSSEGGLTASGPLPGRGLV